MEKTKNQKAKLMSRSQLIMSRKQLKIINEIKEINTKKGNKLPEEAGLNLIKQPEEPNTSIPLTNLTKANHQDWKLFI